MRSVLIDIENSDIIFKVMGFDNMVYKTDINSFVEKTGVTVKNISFPVPGYYIELVDFGEKIICGNIIENIFYDIKKEADLDNVLLIFNFEGVKELSENFFKAYTKMLLETSNKVISINMNIDLSNAFGSFIIKNIETPTENEEEE